MKLTLNIPDSSKNKALPLIEYLKSIDYLTIDIDEESNIPEWLQQIVRERIQNSDTSNLLDWENIKDKF